MRTTPEKEDRTEVGIDRRRRVDRRVCDLGPEIVDQSASSDGVNVASETDWSQVSEQVVGDGRSPLDSGIVW